MSPVLSLILTNQADRQATVRGALSPVLPSPPGAARASRGQHNVGSGSFPNLWGPTVLGVRNLSNFILYNRMKYECKGSFSPRKDTGKGAVFKKGF